MTPNEFVRDYGLTMECIDATGFVTGPVTFRQDSNRTSWLCRIECECDEDSAVRVPFHMGSAHKGEPDLVTVLECLASDAGGVESVGSFEDWAEEMGLEDMSSRNWKEWRKTYEQAKQQTTALRKMLGRDGMEDLAAVEW